MSTYAHCLQVPCVAAQLCPEPGHPAAELPVVQSPAEQAEHRHRGGQVGARILQLPRRLHLPLRSVTLAANLLADYADFSCSLWSHLSVA